MADEHARTKWNMADLYFQKIVEIDEALSVASVQKDPELYYTMLLEMFDKTHMFVWDTTKEKGYEEYVQRFHEVADELYLSDPLDPTNPYDQERLTDLLERLRKLRREYYVLLKHHKVLAPLEHVIDRYNSP